MVSFNISQCNSKIPNLERLNDGSSAWLLQEYQSFCQCGFSRERDYFCTYSPTLVKLRGQRSFRPLLNGCTPPGSNTVFAPRRSWAGRGEQQSTNVSGNIDAIPDVIFHLYGPNNYRGASNNGRANDACGPLLLRRWRHRWLHRGGRLWRLQRLHRPQHFARVHPPAVSS